MKTSAATDQEFFSSSRFVVNLSSCILTEPQVALLEKGLSFVPTTRSFPFQDIRECTTRNTRNLILRDFFQNSDDNYDPNDFKNMFLSKSSWTPSLKHLSPDTILKLDNIASRFHNVTHNRLYQHAYQTFIACRMNNKSNLPASELLAIKQLRTNSNIVIKPADKGGAVVIMDADTYKLEGFRQLLNTHYYQEIERPLTNTNITRISRVLLKLRNTGFITDRQYDFLLPKTPPSQRPFYLLPKIHKPHNKWPHPHMPEGRPIVSDCGSETYNIGAYIDYFLKPLATRHPSYLKDTYDFVAKIRNKPVPSDALIVTGDITALYTNMNIDRSLKIVRDAFTLSPDPRRPDEALLELLEICLKSNDFYFAGKTFLQICGTAMGKTFAPNLANLYLLEFDLAATQAPQTQPLCFYRYIDDLFLIWSNSRPELETYHTFLNSILPGINVTLNIRHEINEFLDTHVYKYHQPHQTTLQTAVFFKPTDTHQLLHGSSFHPKHTIRGIMKSQIIRFKRLSSSRRHFDYACHTLFNVLRHRRYSRSLFRRLKHLIWNNSSPQLLPSRTKTPKNIFPIVNYYDGVGTQLMNIFKSEITDLNYLQNTKIIQAYKIHHNLAKYLTKSRFEDLPSQPAH